MKTHLRAVPPATDPSAGIAGSTLFVIAATLGSVVLGFGREVINARIYGTQSEMDAFLSAATIPTILFGVFNGALVSALVPTFSGYLAHDDEEGAWRLGNTIVSLLALILIACAAIGYLAAPYYVPIVAHGFSGAKLEMTIQMTRMLMPSVVAVSLAGVVSAMLNAYHRFRATAMVGIAVNVVTIAIVLWLSGRDGIYALAFGTAFGLAAQLLVQLPAFLSIGRFRLQLDLRHPGLRHMWSLLGPIVVGSAAGQVALFFDRFFASTLTPGYIAGMNYAVKLTNLPQQVFAAAIATVIFPLIAAQFARANRGAVGRSVVTGLRLVNFITIPALVALIVLARPIVSTLFERGAFGPTATDLCAGLLPFAAAGLVGLAACVVLTRCCFACKEVGWTVAISIFTVVVNVLLSLVWLPTLGARGLLLANSLSQSMQAVLLLALVWRLVGGFELRPLAISTLKILAASGVMLATLHWIGAMGIAPPVTLLDKVWFLFGQLAIGGLSFVAASYVLRIEELPMVWQTIRAKFERNIMSPPDNRDAPIA